MSRWRDFAAYAAVWIVAYRFVPAGAWWQTAWLTGTAWTAALVIVRAVRGRPLADRLPWWCFALGIWLHGSGIVVATLLPGTDPGWLAVPALALHPALAGGLALVVRRRSGSGESGALVESLIVTVGVGLTAWALVEPPTAGIARTAAGDLVLLALVVRLLRGGGARNAALRWIVASSAMVVLGDIGWWFALDAEPGAQWAFRSAQQVHLVAYCCFAVAALHPGAAELTRAAIRRSPYVGAAHLHLLMPAAGLIAVPAVLAWQVLDGEVTDGGAVAVAAAVLVVLVLIRLGQLLGQADRQARQARDTARCDELTGLPNRHAWDDELPRALAQAARSGTTVTVAVLDLDHFATFDQEHGFQAGDELLAAAARAWRGGLHAGDLLARYSGTEFVVLLPGSDANAAAIVLDRLQPVTPLGQSFSAGVATWDVAETPEQVVGRAATARYEAGEAGRRRVTIASPPQAPAGSR